MVSDDESGRGRARSVTARMSTNQLWEEWQNALHRIDKELDAIAVDHYIAIETSKLIRANVRVNAPSPLYSWLRRAHAAYVSLAVRRQLGQKDAENSLYNVLVSVRKHSHVVTFDNYVARHRSRDGMMPEWVLRKWFSRLVGAGNRKSFDALVADDLKKLEKATKEIIKYVNTMIAHSQKMPQGDPPTWRDLDKSLLAVLRVADRYLELFCGVRRTTWKARLPVWIDDWKQPLRHRWINE